MKNTPAAIVEEYLKKQPRGFHPTDKEIVQYIKEKYGNKNIPSGVITQVMNLNNCEPWELLPEEKLGEELYFLCQPELKYGKGVRMNRQTKEGYWKSTGNMKEISEGGSVIGRRYTLAFHTGKAPKGKKTNWIVHEYKLDPEFHKRKSKDEWVICKIFLTGTSKNKITSSKANEENGIEINYSSSPPPPRPQEDDIVDIPNDLNILASSSGFYQNQFTNNFPGMENEWGIEGTSENNITTSNTYEENGIEVNSSPPPPQEDALVDIPNCPNILDSSYNFDTYHFINNSPSMEDEYGIGEFYSLMNIEDVIVDEIWG